MVDGLSIPPEDFDFSNDYLIKRLRIAIVLLAIVILIVSSAFFYVVVNNDRELAKLNNYWQEQQVKGCSRQVGSTEQFNLSFLPVEVPHGKGSVD